MSLKKNLCQVQRQIQESLNKAGRLENELHLIAVSKTRTIAEIEELYQLGQYDFGENKPQEIRDKVPNLANDIRWHMIGHLQTNKIKYVVGNCALIHSVDSFHLAQKIDAFSQKKNLITNILLQLDLAKDGKKQGFLERDFEEKLKQISDLENIKVKGLMTIAPFFENPEKNRGLFQKMKQIFVDIQAKKLDNIDMSVLSMGMSNDFQIAIEEGATHVRIGTAIFGKRNYMR